jgi:Retrotransposon gag protein
MSTFKEAADLNLIIEGMTVLILPYFLEGRAKSGLSSRLKQAASSLPKFPVALQWLLHSFATEAVIAAACQKLFSANQMPEEDAKTYANRLTRNAAKAGSVFTEDALMSTFVDGLHPYEGNMVRGQVTPVDIRERE